MQLSCDAPSLGLCCKTKKIIYQLWCNEGGLKEAVLLSHKE